MEEKICLQTKLVCFIAYIIYVKSPWLEINMSKYFEWEKKEVSFYTAEIIFVAVFLKILLIHKNTQYECRAYFFLQSFLYRTRQLLLLFISTCLIFFHLKKLKVDKTGRFFFFNFDFYFGLSKKKSRTNRLAFRADQSKYTQIYFNFMFDIQNVRKR